MVRSKLATAILSASLALPGVASALGIGDYTQNSFLNQPLEMEIDLAQTKDLTSDEVIAGLASPEEFARAGIDRPFFLTDMRFDIRQRPDGRLYIVVETSRAVTEPFLNFLLEVQWPQGRMLKEYTILLDPPVYKAGAAQTATSAPVSSAQPAMPASVPQQQPVAPVAPVAAPLPAYNGNLPPPPSATKGRAPAHTSTPRSSSDAAPMAEGDYRVGGNDTMLAIARKLRPASASVQQTMIAIQRANGDAFLHDNINLIRRGAVLRIPSEADIQSVSSGEANGQLADQNRAWRELVDRRQAAMPAAGAQIEAGGAVKAAAAPAKGTAGQVTLVAPKGSDKGGKASGGKEVAGLQNQLAVAEEGLDKAARENKDLSSRVADLDKQVKNSEKLLAMKDDQISALQTELNKLRKQKGLAPVAPPVAAKDTKPAAVAQTPAPAVPPPEAAKLSPVPPPAADVVAKPIAKPVVAEEPVKPAKKESGRSLLAPIGGLLALLAAGGAGVWWWRRKQQTAVASPAEAVASEHDAQVEDDLAQLRDFNLAAEEPEHDEYGDDSVGGLASAPSDADHGDPLGEADMYVAYGRFQQAADILYAALQRDPSRTDLRLKLAEVYVEMGNNDAAREEASKVASGGDSGARRQAEAILAKVGGGAAAPAAEESLPSLDDLALEFSGGGDTGGHAQVSAPEAADEFAVPAADAAGDDLDFSLDDMVMGDESAEKAAADSVAASLDDGLEEMSLEDSGLDDFSFDAAPTATTPAVGSVKPAAPSGPTADELALESELDFAVDSGVTHIDESPGADSAFEDLDAETMAFDASEFDAVDGAEPEELELAVPAEDAPAAMQEVTAVRPTVTDADIAGASGSKDLDLEAELADLEADLSGEGVGGAKKDGDGDDFDFLADSDENATKLDLARAYIDMGDADGARDILNEVLADGSADQKSEAQKLLTQVG